jgi:hypothetical protein
MVFPKKLHLLIGCVVLGLSHDARQVFSDADPGGGVTEGVNDLLETSRVVDGTSRVGSIERF